MPHKYGLRIGNTKESQGKGRLIHLRDVDAETEHSILREKVPLSPSVQASHHAQLFSTITPQPAFYLEILLGFRSWALQVDEFL